MSHLFLAFAKGVKVLTVIVCISPCVAACKMLDIFQQLILFKKSLSKSGQVPLTECCKWEIQRKVTEVNGMQ